MHTPQNLQTLLEEFRAERADVDAIVDRRLRENIRRRFPGYSFEEVAADARNTQKIANLRIKLRSDFLEIFDRYIATIEDAIAREEAKTRKKRKLLKSRRLIRNSFLRQPQPNRTSH